jgi:3-isopropylmalate dehydrogenase
VDDPGGIKRWSAAIDGRHVVDGAPTGPVRIGVLPGEGVGPEVVRAALGVLSAVASECGFEIALREAPPAGDDPSAPRGLTEPEARFCRDTFAAGGAVLAGAHGGRWVYEVRRRLDLFCKISPIRPASALGEIDAPISPRRLVGVDLLVVREQSGGLYQGRWGESATRNGRVAEHSFSYEEGEVCRIVTVATALARSRSGRLGLVVKDGGVPSISRLWRDCAEELVGDDLDLEVLDVDYAVYRMLRDPGELDVLVAPNHFGDLLSDAGGALLGSRGNTYGGNFDAARAAIYQTNHGAAHDLAGHDRANPVGQILAAAMMLRESFGLEMESALIERAITGVWRDGWRTEDVAEPGCRVVGTREMGERIAERIAARVEDDPVAGRGASVR